MPRYKRFLIVKANGDTRVVRRTTHLAMDEVAYPLIIDMPAAWGRVSTDEIQVRMPEPPRVEKGPR